MIPENSIRSNENSWEVDRPIRIILPGCACISVLELRTAFEDAVEDYLETCRKIGKQPQKTYSGKLTLRIPAQVHGAVAQAAEPSGKSINQWAADMLERAAHSH
jgi:predicted HicB family RNase H-like nuclease